MPDQPSTPSLPLNAPGAPLFRDHLETKAATWIRPWDGTERADVLIVGAPLSKTSISHSGASQTPQAIREMLAALTTYDIEHDIDLAERLVARDAGDARVHVTDLASSRSGIREAVAAVLARGGEALTVVLGGDHSITAPSVEAFAARVGGPVGLIQLDAHMDLRNLEDGGASNGTPIRQLLEGSTLEGRHIVQMGLHPFANARAYREVARAAGITQMTARDVVMTPADALAQRALDVAGNGTDAVYVTLDMDVLAQAFAPGVPALVPGGMTPWQLLGLMFALGRDERVCALDIVEVDPTQDPRRQTVRVAAHALMMFLSGYASRGDAA